MAATEEGKSAAEDHAVVSREEWLSARQALLARERELSHLRDDVSRQRRAMPWVRVETNYTFQGPDGEVTLADLFGDHKELFVQHFMFDPAWERGCSSCSLWGDGYAGLFPHIQRKCAFAVVAAAPQEKLRDFVAWKGWPFPMYSAQGSTFNADFGVEFTEEEAKTNARTYNYGVCPVFVQQMPGASVFAKKEDGSIYHTYSTYARGLENTASIYNLLDCLPGGRAEKTNMDWLKHAQEYGAAEEENNADGSGDGA